MKGKAPCLFKKTQGKQYVRHEGKTVDVTTQRKAGCPYVKGKLDVHRKKKNKQRKKPSMQK